MEQTAASEEAAPVAMIREQEGQAVLQQEMELAGLQMQPMVVAAVELLEALYLFSREEH